ncbi:uncharacterized protein TNCV_97201 [Trichonephila clavipes]|nr:uncharacterized protein TNCV_97201 [Trichonephila clavipes]
MDFVVLNLSQVTRTALDPGTLRSNTLHLDNEDFGKRNIPGKRARRHFSQLSEMKKGLIIGMKTAGWSTRRVAGQVDRSECAVRNCWEQWTREGTHARKPGLERPGRPRGERIEGSCGKHLWTPQ